MAEHGALRVEEVMGTVISLDVRDEIDNAMLDDVFVWFHWVDEVFSPYSPESALSRLGRCEVALSDCPPEMADVLEWCDELTIRSGGYFDVHADPRWPLDACALVKGWSVEVASEMLDARGLFNHCINAGGDIRTRGYATPGQPWQVGIAHPMENGALTVAIEVTDSAVATSGTHERGFHVIDPHTGRPVYDLASVTVVGPSLTFADGYATAALAMGLGAPEWLSGLEGHEAYVVDAGGFAWWTEGLAQMAHTLPSRPSV